MADDAPEGGVRRQFQEFFRNWLVVQERDLQSLRAAVASAVDDWDPGLRDLIHGVIEHYENYYRAKAAAARRDVTSMFSPSWTSSTEDVFLWVGGWRPTMAIQLLYSKVSLQFQSRLQAHTTGDPEPDLACLSHDQLERVDQLHRLTLRLEKEITEEEAISQEKVAGAEMVEMSHAISAGGLDVVGLEVMGPAMERRAEEIEKVLGRADRLRMDTLRAVVGILRPMQAAHYLIAAAELHLRLHEFGVKKDSEAAPPPGTGGGASESSASKVEGPS